MGSFQKHRLLKLFQTDVQSPSTRQSIKILNKSNNNNDYYNGWFVTVTLYTNKHHHHDNHTTNNTYYTYTTYIQYIQIHILLLYTTMIHTIRTCIHTWEDLQQQQQQTDRLISSSVSIVTVVTYCLYSFDSTMWSTSKLVLVVVVAAKKC